MKSIHCPLCNGIFALKENFDYNKIKPKRIKARALRERGLTIRAIMKIMNYKSPRSVQDLLDND